MTRRQKGKGHKRLRSWHRGRNQDDLWDTAAMAMAEAQRRTSKRLAALPSATPASPTSHSVRGK